MHLEALRNSLAETLRRFRRPSPRQSLRRSVSEAPPSIARRLAISIAAMAALAACSSFGPDPKLVGASADDVVAKMGRPTHRYPLPAGERLEYAHGPFGRSTVMVDLDGSNKVNAIREVLTEKTFAEIRPGQDRQDVLLRIGAPGERYDVGLVTHRVVWGYRYDTPFCRWFVVEIDDAGKVVDTAYLIDPLCEADINS